MSAIQANITFCISNDVGIRKLSALQKEPQKHWGTYVMTFSNPTNNADSFSKRLPQMKEKEKK